MLTILAAIAIALGCLLALATLPGSVELLLLTAGGILPAPRRWPHSGEAGKRLRIAVVAPAHNEEAGIADCVRSLRACEDGGHDVTVAVVADNCDDETARLAYEAGAMTLERRDPERRGKGRALDYAFGKLLPQGFDAFIVVDADTEASPNLIAEFGRAFASGADALQCRYLVKNPGASLRTRLMGVAFMAFNVLRPRGRDRFGLSAGILGNGFGLTRETLQAVPYEARSVVEDLEYHIRLVRSGRASRFVDKAWVRSAMPVSGRSARTQRARWEGGRLRMIRVATGGLLADVLRGRLRLIEPLLDLLLQPLAFHALLAAAAAAPPFLPTRVYAAAALGIVAAHALAGVAVGRGGIKDVASLALAPFYALWKLTVLRLVARTSRPDAEWVRTERKPTEGEE